MRISDWSSDVCSSDLAAGGPRPTFGTPGTPAPRVRLHRFGSGESSMLKHLLLAALIAAAPAAYLHAAEPAPSATSDSAAKQTLDAFFAAQWERGLPENPEGATSNSYPTLNALRGDYPPPSPQNH